VANIVNATPLGGLGGSFYYGGRTYSGGTRAAAETPAWKPFEAGAVALRTYQDTPGATTGPRTTGSFYRQADASLTINGQSLPDYESWDYSSSGSSNASPPAFGGVGFHFSAMNGTIDNVTIRGVLDMEWFYKMTKDIKK
jgi:hypothetical protein